MRNLFTSALLAATVMLGGSAAQAFTLPGQPSAPEINVESVAGGCGPGWFRDRFGRCRPAPRVYAPGYGYGPGYVYAPRTCFIRPTPWGPRRVCR
ncbi:MULTISPECIES: GCG_CRPN prefix-to-repeats domain-containing protein [Bradyrhizobium]|uniref:Uncharacterized protein n=1 Tax=Bradyrhizobium aeschynomenes TaxID=2734909 RepID=A0ABX2CCI7_9BRAD|nr:MULTISPECIES: hypothetical protein [Bradyrhizobium]NPU65929.1 hypothetical protein [Bradyrhizobium aeschynomenes]